MFLSKSDVDHSKKPIKRMELSKESKITDAFNAGKFPSKCMLFVCEGDSASSFVIAGLPEHLKPYVGILRLGGKISNFRNMSYEALSKS